MSLTSITVVANRVRPDGSTPAGQIMLALSAPMTNGVETVTPSPVVAPLLAGVATASVYANDDTGTSPTTTHYTVTENVEGAPPVTSELTVSHTAAGGTINI